MWRRKYRALTLETLHTGWKLFTGLVSNGGGSPPGRNRMTAKLLFRMTAKLVFWFISSNLSPSFKKQKDNWRIYLRSYCSWFWTLKPESAVPCSGCCWRCLPTWCTFFSVWKDLAVVQHCSGTVERVQQGWGVYIDTGLFIVWFCAVFVTHLGALSVHG